MNQLQFGVENLQLCNLQSLTIMDMKIFLYLTSFQAISFFKSQNSPKNPNFFLPYWLVSSNLGTEIHQEWWSLCYDLLFNPLGKKTLDKIDIKTQNNLVKILELIRLKSNMVKLSLGTVLTKNDEKLKLNIKTCMKLAKYLEYMIETLKTNKCDLLHDSFFSASSESFCSPKERLEYLKRYKLTYWNFVTKQLIKLKQLSLINNQSIDTLDLSSINSVLIGNTSINNATIITPDRQLPTKHCTPPIITPKLEDKIQIEIKNYFDFYECNLPVDDVKENLEACIFSRDEFEYDATIETGLLSLILNHVQIDSYDENEIDNDLNEKELELIPRINVSSLANLNEAVSLFSLANSSKNLDYSLNECEESNLNRLNFFQLQVIKYFFFKIISLNGCFLISIWKAIMIQ